MKSQINGLKRLIIAVTPSSLIDFRKHKFSDFSLVHSETRVLKFNFVQVILCELSYHVNRPVAKCTEIVIIILKLTIVALIGI